MRTKPRYTSLGDKYLMFGMLEKERNSDMSKIKEMIRMIANQEYIDP